MQVPPVIQQLLARIPDHALCGQNSGITSQEKLATVHSTTPASGGAVGGGTPLTGSILTDDAVLNDLQPGEKQAYNSVKSTQVDELFDVVTKFSADEFLKTALANTIHANSANVQVQPQQQLATKPVQHQTPGQIPNPSAINGLHQTMQQLMPGAANPTQGMPLLAPSPAPGALSQPGLSGGQGGKATAVPGLAGQAATNVIDQQGALDASGTTVDGNHSSLVSKAAAAGGVGNLLQSLGYKAVNNNQPQTVHSDGKSYTLQDLMNHASGRLPAGETPDSLDIVEAMMSLDAAKQKQAGQSRQKAAYGDVAEGLMRGGSMGALMGAFNTRHVAKGVPGGGWNDTPEVQEAIAEQNAAKSRLQDMEWYNPQKINHNVLAPLMDILGPVASIGGGAATGIATANPLAGAGVGAILGQLGGLPRQWATQDLNNWATENVSGSDRTPEHKKRLLADITGTRAPQLMTHMLGGGLAGLSAGLGSSMKSGSQKAASTAVYGYCPKCGAPGETRERRINGNDTCENGHKYPSRDALKQQKTAGKA